MPTSRLLFWIVFGICVVSPLLTAVTPWLLSHSWSGLWSVGTGYLVYLGLLSPWLFQKKPLTQGQKLCFISTVSVRTFVSQYLAFALLIFVIPPFYAPNPTWTVLACGCMVSGIASLIDFKLNQITKRFTLDPTTNR